MPHIYTFARPIPMLRRSIRLAMILMVITVAAHAQGTRGVELWTGFMFNVSASNQPGDMSLFITSRVTTGGTVSIPAAGWSTSFFVPANTGTVVKLPSAMVMSYGSEGIEWKGVRVLSNDTVDVFAMNYVPQTVDASPVFALDALGSDYRVLSYMGTIADTGPFPSQFLVISPRNQTMVEITPAAHTIGGRAAGVPFTITLEAGEMMQVQSRGDLTGSRIRTLDGKKIAVISGTARSEVPVGFRFTDHLYEQMYPIERWGTVYATVPLKGRRSDLFRILASENNTTVTLDGANPFVINAGEFREMQLGTATIIAADRPVTVGQYSNGATFDNLQSADPFLMVLNPVDFMRSELRFYAFPFPTYSFSYVNIMTLTEAVPSARLDGQPIASHFKPYPYDPFYSYAQIEVGPGEHNLTADFGFVAHVYGTGDLEAYGYSTGAERLLPCPNPSVNVIGDTVFCEGGSVTLDAGGGYRSYRWSTGDTTRQITVTQSGVYNVVTRDVSGCLRPSRPVRVSVLPRPSAAVAVIPSNVICPCDTATLTAPPGYIYQWSNGDTSQSIRVNQAGNYTVTVRDTFGCSAASETIAIAIDDVHTVVTFGSDSAAPGERVTIPLTATTIGGAACGLRNFTATVRFDPTIFIPAGINGATVARDSIGRENRYMTITGSAAGDTIAQLDFQVALGGSVATLLTIESFRWDDCGSILIDTTNGLFVLRDICYEGGPRLIDASGATGMKRSTPNPVKEFAIIEYQLAEEGFTELYLVDITGRKVATLASGAISPGIHSATLDARTLPAGTYFYILQTPSERFTERVEVR